MNFIKKTASVALSFVLIMSQMIMPAYATETQSVIERCVDKAPIFNVTKNAAGNELTIQESEQAKKTLQVKEGEGEFTADEFRQAYERAGLRYHQYVQCIFDESVEEIVPDWFKTDKKDKEVNSCIDQAALTQQIGINANMPAMVDELTFAFHNYADHLNNLMEEYVVIGDLGQAPSDIISTQDVFKELIKNEVSNTGFALDAAFARLKEMRQAYLMHVQFSCMLENLKKYRDAMKEYRKVILDMEPRFDSASLTCPL